MRRFLNAGLIVLLSPFIVLGFLGYIVYSAVHDGALLAVLLLAETQK